MGDSSSASSTRSSGRASLKFRWTSQALYQRQDRTASGDRRTEGGRDLHRREDHAAGHSRANSSIAVAATFGALPYTHSVVRPISSRVVYRYPPCWPTHPPSTISFNNSPRDNKILNPFEGQHPLLEDPPT